MVALAADHVGAADASGAAGRVGRSGSTGAVVQVSAGEVGGALLKLDGVAVGLRRYVVGVIASVDAPRVSEARATKGR